MGLTSSISLWIFFFPPSLLTVTATGYIIILVFVFVNTLLFHFCLVICNGTSNVQMLNDTLQLFMLNIRIIKTLSWKCQSFHNPLEKHSSIKNESMDECKTESIYNTCMAE